MFLSCFYCLSHFPPLVFIPSLPTHPPSPAPAAGPGSHREGQTGHPSRDELHHKGALLQPQPCLEKCKYWSAPLILLFSFMAYIYWLIVMRGKNPACVLSQGFPHTLQLHFPLFFLMQTVSWEMENALKVPPSSLLLSKQRNININKTFISFSC